MENKDWRVKSEEKINKNNSYMWTVQMEKWRVKGSEVWRDSKERILKGVTIWGWKVDENDEEKWWRKMMKNAGYG